MICSEVCTPHLELRLIITGQSASEQILLFQFLLISKFVEFLLGNQQLQKETNQ